MEKKTTIKKNKQGYGYKYTELAEINKYCEDNGISYYQETETCEINQKDYIITYLVENGEITKHRGCQIVDAVLSGIKNPVQEYGSSLTYCRRYSLLMALGLATEDDDAQSLNKRTTTKTTQSNGKVTPAQLKLLEQWYKGEKLQELLDKNEIDKLEDLPIGKASEIIKFVTSKQKEKENTNE